MWALLLPCLLAGLQAQQSVMDYDTLAARKEGRHFLVTTLLEKLYAPLSASRYRGKVVFQLPPSLGGNPDVESTAPCCKLKEVPFRYQAGRYTDKLLRQVLQKEGLLDYVKGAPVFDFDVKVKEDINTLVNIINGDERPFDHMFSIAAATKDLVNENLFAKAIVIITMGRTDVGFAVPMAMELKTKEFMPHMEQLQRQMRQLDDEGRMDADQEIIVDWEKPEYRTYPEDEPENKMWYIREDPEVNSHHWYWHILFGNLPGFNIDKQQSRRGELFYYLHNQVCNRYNFERLSNGLEPVEPFGPEHWGKPIPLGYDAKLGELSAVYYPPRYDNVTWYGHPQSTREHKQLVLNLEESIRKGFMTKKNGDQVPIGQEDGIDFGVEPLGATVEKDPKRGLNNETYGDIHNGGHKWMSQAGLHPQLVKAGIYNAVGNTATECRDPLLYRWHAYVDGLFGQYKKTLPDYTDEQLNFPGLELQEVSVHSSTDDENSVSGQTFIRNKMFTHMEMGDVGFYGIDINNTFSDRVRIKYKKLNHSPFEYRFRVKNSGPAQRGLVRIFLADEQGLPTQIEMDKFIWNFHSGEYEFKRSYDDSSSVPRRPLGLYEIQENSFEGVMSEVDDPMINEYTGCGWAKHLLVPRGNPQGFDTNLLVVISPLLPEDDAATTNWETVSTLSHSLCGAPGAAFPDSRPMGFPFDRYREPSHWRGVIQGRANMKRVGVTIFHLEECKSDRDCTGGNNCDRAMGRCMVAGQVEKPRGGRNQPLEKSACPVEAGTRPNIQVERAGMVDTVQDCEDRCRGVEDCAHFEWQEVGRRGRCLLYMAVQLKPGFPKSTSGKKRCGGPVIGRGTCTIRDRQPVLRYVNTWRQTQGVEECRGRCDGEAGCQYWELKVGFLGGDVVTTLCDTVTL